MSRNSSTTFIVHQQRAYTEDSVEVYNLFVYNISPKLKEEDLLGYFSQFGAVMFVRLAARKSHSKRHRIRTGFVYYWKSESAYKALSVLQHFIKRKPIGLDAADSWRQPKYAVLAAAKSMTPTSLNMAVAQEASNRSVYFCREILLNLPLQEQILLVLSWPHYRDAFMQIRNNYKVFHMNRFQLMTLSQIREFFKIAGGFIRTLIVPRDVKYRRRISLYVKIFCRNLKTLIMFEYWTWYMMKQLLVPSLNGLELHYFPSNWQKLFAQLPNLKSLALIGSIGHVGGLQQLNHFTFYQSPLDSVDLVDILAGCNNVTYLNLLKCKHFNWSVLTAIVLFCEHVNTLEIPWMAIDYECLLLMTNLRHLILQWDRRSVPSDSVLRAFAADAWPKLQSLKLIAYGFLNATHVSLITRIESLEYFSCSNNNLPEGCVRLFCQLSQLSELVLTDTYNLDSDSLLFVVRHCPNLCRLHVQNCANLSADFATKCGEILLQQKRDKPLRLFLKNTAVSEEPDCRKYPLLEVDLKSPSEDHTEPYIRAIPFISGPAEAEDSGEESDDFGDIDVSQASGWLPI